MDSYLKKKIRQDLQDIRDFFFSGFRMKPEKHHPPGGGNLSQNKIRWSLPPKVDEVLSLSSGK
jgi:hypothetical protein